ncbi:MAG: hypothetical protein ACTSRA_20005, partial [Promethearchaeota archaeon]
MIVVRGGRYNASNFELPSAHSEKVQLLYNGNQSNTKLNVIIIILLIKRTGHPHLFRTWVFGFDIEVLFFEDLIRVHIS